MSANNATQTATEKAIKAMNESIKQLIGLYYLDEESNFLESFDEVPSHEAFMVQAESHVYYHLLVIDHKGNIDVVNKFLGDLYMDHYGYLKQIQSENLPN